MKFGRITSFVLAVAVVMSGGLLWAQETTDPASEKTVEAKKVDPAWLAPFSFRNIGPALMSGRIADVAIDQQQPNTWYVAAGSGGLWKTTNSGTSWTPIFDTYASYSLGCVTIDPSDRNTIWVGTGENVAGRHVGYGDGVYVSRDGGKTFQNKGLKQSEHIGKIVVDPNNSLNVFVAVQGPLWATGGERGLYKSTDGGETWRQVISGGPYSGATDLQIDPTDSRVLYAATHQRHRTVWALLDTGPESGIHKSVDGGETWTKLSNGLPGEDKGKISLAISPQKSNVVYATIELPNRAGGFWRSEDHGNSWNKVSDFVSGGTGPHYYQEIYVDPHRYDVIYHANNMLVRSIDGGKTWDVIEGRWKHVDNHAVAFHPTDADFALFGTDGGLYESHDFAASYRFFANLSLTQFYKVDVDYDLPFYHVIGGTQDNSTQYGPSRTRNVQGIRNSDWIVPVGGDGHDNAIDPSNPDIIYGESQEGFIRRFDRKSGETIDIQPQPGKGEEALRFNWDSPILISPHNPNRIYFASRMLHRSDDRGESWTTISPDLSRSQNRWALPIMGRVWGIDAGFDLMAMSKYGNITSLSESPKVEGLIYAGTDDGLIHVTEDGGKNWRKIEKIYGVPENAFVNDVKADRHDPNTVYAAMDSHKTGDFKSYLVRSRDRGVTWESIVGDLPERHLVWRIEQDHVRPELMFTATEFGIFVTLDGGEKWLKMTAGLPTISFRDLAIQQRENDLVGASFGRGFYVLDDYSPLREFTSSKVTDSDFHIFPVRKTPWYIQADALGGEKGFQGDDFFNSPNPSYGTVFTVFIKSVPKSKKALRQEKEATAKSENKDAEIPSWEELQSEADEATVQYYLEITDASGRLINRVACGGSEGIQRVSWNLRHSLPGSGFSHLALPGTYRAQGCKISGVNVTKLGESVEFLVESIVNPAIPPQDRAEVSAFLNRAFQIQRSMNEVSSKLALASAEIVGRTEMIKANAKEIAPLLAVARRAQLQLNGITRRMNGDPLKAQRAVTAPPSISARISGVVINAANNTFGPTKTQRAQIDIGEQELAELKGEFEAIEKADLTELRNQMKAAGLDWFPSGTEIVQPPD